MAGMALFALVAHQEPSRRAFLLAGGVSLCLYAFGLILNDLVDYSHDRLCRPERPLPIGDVSSEQALLLALALLGGGMYFAYCLGFPALMMSIVLAFLIGTYNLLSKNIPCLGSLNMGLCRGVSFLLGVDPKGWFGLPGIAALGVVAFIAAVTSISKHETTTHSHGREAWLPTGVLAILFVSVWVLWLPYSTPGHLVAVSLLFAGSVMVSAVTSWRLAAGPASPAKTQAAVGAFICNLIFVQAPFLFLLPATIPLGIALLAGWPLARWLGTRYAGS